MTDRPPSPFEAARAELRAIGILLDSVAAGYRVNRRGGTEATAYMTDDLQDALAHGHSMAVATFIDRGQRAQAAVDEAIAVATRAAAEPGVRAARRRRRPLKMTPKAVRRRQIRKHNARMRARARSKADDQ